MQSSSFSRFGGYLREKWASPRRIRFWLLVLILLYTLLGFFAVPWAVQRIAINSLEEDFGRELRIESVQANPYKLTLQIDGLELDDIDNKKLLSWDQLFVDLAWSSIIEATWVVETIRFDQPVIQEERFASGETRFLRLAATPPETAPSDSEPSALPALQINEFRLNGGILSFTDNFKETTSTNATQATQASLTLQDIGLIISDFSLQEGTRFPINLNGQLAQGGALSFDGTMQLLPNPALEGSADINELALKQAEPYLQQFANVQLNSGDLTLSGQVQTDAQQPFAFEGSAAINALDIRRNNDDDTLVGWQSLKTELLEFDLKENSVKTEIITIAGLSGRLVINQDKTTNFGELLITSTEEQETSKSKTAAPIAMTIEGVELTEGAIHFADNSLPLPFSTRIHALNGEVSTLSSSSEQPAQVKLEGEVAEYGLAQVEGTLNVWDPTRQTNVQVMFRNLQVPEYSPYTVDFAGRKIAGGTMDLDLNYTINNEQLDGQNNLVLTELKLGEKMASSDAMDLPLNLAIALLQDSNGVIDLTLPVSGNVGSPEFDFGSVIRQAIGDAITSVITAPFSFLANLVGAESEDLGKVEFLAGRSDLLPPQRERVAKLREALNKRPALVLELAGPYSRTFDGPSVRQEKALEALRQRLSEAGRNVDNLNLTAESNQDILETMFADNYPEVDLESVRDRFTEEQDELLDEAEFDALAYRNHLAEQVTAAQTVRDADLEAIAIARASAVKEALANPDTEDAIAADRVRILPSQAIDSVEGKRIVMEVGVSAN